MSRITNEARTNGIKQQSLEKRPYRINKKLRQLARQVETAKETAAERAKETDRC